MDLREKRQVLEDFVIIAGLIAVQFVYAGNSVLASYLMSLGLNPFSLIIFSSFATFLVLSPPSFLFERKQWPKKFSLKLLIQLVLIAFSGVTLFQSLMLKGLKLTSPAMATAMPNLAPGFIFAIAWACRLEKVKANCLYSKVKIIGTLLCVVGAIAMSILQSTTTGIPSTQEVPLSVSPSQSTFDHQKILGCLYLMVAVFVLSSNIVLQAHTLVDFPAPMSLCTITSLIGVVTTALVELGQDHKFEFGWPGVDVKNLIGYSLLAGTISGTCVSFNGWAMKKRGPVLVSMFSPISTVISAAVSVITLGEKFSLGSVVGMLLMFTGLYFVLWAKGKEGYSTGEEMESEHDVEKPLLS